MPKFDIAAALADGYSYSEIASYLSDLHGFDLNAAKYDGIGEKEVAGFLSAREVRPPVESDSDFGAGVKQLGRLAYDFPTQVQGAAGALMYDPLEPEGTGARWMDVADKRNRERAAQLELEGTAEKKFLPGISVGNVQDASSSTGFSAVAMGPSIAGEIGATLAAKAPNPAVKLGGQALSYLGGAAGSAVSGYKMDEAMFTKQLLERANQQMLRTDGRPMTDEETRKYLDETAEIRSQHGLWEAGPEAVGNALEVIGLRKIFSGLAKGNLLGAVAGMVMNQATEHTTETITGMGQQPLEVAGGLSNEKPYEMGNPQDWGAAFKEQAPVTAVLGGVTGGAAGAAGKLYGMTRPPLQATPEPERQVPDFEADRQQVESLQVPTPIIPPLKPTDFAGISAVPDALSAMRTQPTVTAKVDTATQQVENATTPRGYGNPLDTAGEIITAVRGADEAKLAELEKAIEAPELDDFAASIRGDIADRREELAKRPEILPADPQPDQQLIERTLAAISTADQPTLLQMADGLPGLVEGSPELAPYQRQLSEAISKRQRILWEESNVGRGKISSDSGAPQGQPEQPSGIRDIEPIRGDSGRQGDGESGEGGSGTTEESPLLTAARQHVAETGDMTMGGLMKALDVDIDTAEALLEQVKATTPLPRNIGGTQVATVGADTGGLLTDQAIRKAGATSTATTAGDAQGFIADQGIRKAAGAVTAAPGADTEGFVRDQQIRRDAMGRGPKPTRAADEPARAFLARKREWAKGATPEKETIDTSKDVLVGKNPFGKNVYQRPDGERYLLRFDRKDRPDGYIDFGGVLVTEEEEAADRVSRTGENETQEELPRTDETQAGVGGAGDMKKLVASIKKSDAKLEKLHEGQLNRMKNGGQSRATSTTYAARSGQEAKHRDGEARVLANIARAELRAGRAVPQDVLDILGSKIEYNRSGDYEPIEGVTSPSPGEASPPPAAKGNGEGGPQKYTVANRWDSSKDGYKVELVKRGQWTTKKDGGISRLGEKIALSKWDDLSPAAQRILTPLIQADYGSRVVEATPAAQPSASKATPEKPAGVATSGQRQEQSAKEPWQMTREEYLADALERNEYRDQYKANPKLLPPFEENIEREWRRSVEKAAETDRIPDAVLDSYLERFGKQVFASTFRGIAEKGVQGYFYPEIRAEQEAAPADKKTAIYDLRPHERTWAQQRGEERKAMGRMLTKAEWKELREQHKSAVQKALWNGEKVPASVLADYPELADAKTRKDADMADVAETDFGNMGQPAQTAQAEAASGERGEEAQPKAPSPQTALAAHLSTIKKMRNGEATVAEYRESFERVIDEKEAIIEELSDLTKAQIFERFVALAYRYKNEKKAEIVRAAYSDMVMQYNLSDSFSYMLGQKIEDVMRQKVEAATQADLDTYAEERKSSRQAAKEEAKRTSEALQGNIETMEEYRLYLRGKMSGGLSLAAARRTLPVEVRAKFDDMEATETRDRRKSMKDADRGRVTTAAVTTSGEVIETKHTKTGEPLFVVKAAERVERDVYNEWNRTAKRMGGWYSSYRAGGAVPGFQFKTRESADAFSAYLAGETGQVKDIIDERRSVYEDNKEQSAVERLRSMADSLEERADERLSADRLTNTTRRARMAASAESAAEADKAMAATMRNIAAAIESGAAKFLNRVRTKVQVEMLLSKIRSAKNDALRERYPNDYSKIEEHKHEKPTAETADYVEFPRYRAFRSDLASIARQLAERDGSKRTGESLLKVADDVTSAYLKFAKEDLHKVARYQRSNGELAIFASKAAAEAAIKRSGHKGKAVVLPFKRAQNIIIMSPQAAREAGLWQGDDDKLITLTDDFGREVLDKAKAAKISVPWMFEVAKDQQTRLKNMGVETPAELRAAVREFIDAMEVAKQNKVRELELAMSGRRVKDGLDFFPTPESVARDMVDTAGIEEGMSVLEPSAGMGHIAEVIRETGVDPDVVELSGDRRELLEAKGFRVVGNNFMEMSPRGFTFGDTYKAPDGTVGIMRGAGGMGSDRVRLVVNGDERTATYQDRDDLVPVKKNGSNSGYDRIVMNPPFSDRRDIEHVQHAYELLKPGGRLVSIMGEGSFFGSDKKAVAFREWLESVGGTSEKLPEGTFNDKSLPVTTGVNTRMVVIDKPIGAETPVSDEEQEAVEAEQTAQAEDAPVELEAETATESPTRLHTVSGYPSDNATKKHMLEAIAEARKELPEPSPKDGFGNAERIDWPKPTTEKSHKIYRLAGNFKLVVDPTGYARLVEDMGSSGKDGSKIPDKVHGKPIGSLAEAKLWAEYYLLGKAEPSGPPHVFRGKNKEYEYTIPNSAYALDNFEKKVKGSSGVKFAKALPPSARADIPGELTQAFGKLRARVLMRKITVLGSQEEAKALVRRLGGKLSAAWHGSPHDFDEFRMSAVGTGEGAQAYGYGLYFASAKAVAEHYKKKLSEGSPVHYKGRDIGESFGGYGKNHIDALMEIASAIKNGKSPSEAISDASESWAYWKGVYREAYDNAESDEMKESAKEYADMSSGMESIIASLDPTDFKQKPGRLYKVELAPQVDEYLLWDRPLSEQSEKVRKALAAGVGEQLAVFRKDQNSHVAAERLARWRQIEEAASGSRNMTGAGAYDSIASGLGANVRKASEYLHSLGIRGIKYMGESSYNYVIFDEKDIEITAKYSKDGAIQGFAVDGKVYLVKDAIEKGHTIPVLKHEFAHIARLGLRGTKPWQALLRSVDERMNEDSATGKALREARKKVPADTDASLMAEETLAYAIENSPEVGLVRRAIAMIKRFLVNMGVSPNIFTVEDWSELAAATLRGQARVAMGEGVRQSVRDLFKPVDTNSAAFREWARGSVVRDVQYHWTDAEFDAFDMEASDGMAHFGTKQAAADRAGGHDGIGYDIEEDDGEFWVYADAGPNDGEGVGPFKMESEAKKYIKTQPKRIAPIAVYLNIKNPLRVPDFGVWTLDGVRTYLYNENVINKRDADKVWKAWQNSSKDGYEALRLVLEKKGYDGFVYENEQEDPGSDSYVVLSPTQIKSATENTGAFSPTDPRIRYSKQFDDGEVEAAMQVKSALHKNDLKWWERIFKTFDYLSRIDPAAKRIFQYGSEDRRENKVRLEDRILDDISVPDGAYIDPQYSEKKEAGFVSFLTSLQKKDKATYTAANDYLLTVDRTGKAFSVKRQGGYTVKSPDGEVLATGLRTKEDGYTVIRDHHAANYGKDSAVLKKDYSNDKQSTWVVTNQKGAVLSEHDTEAEAVAVRREAEAGKMRADGKDEKTIAAVMKFREMTDRAFDLMAGDLRRVIDEAERLGLDEPTMEVVDERKRYVILDARGNKVPESYYETSKDAELFAKSISHKGRFQVKKQADNEILMPMTLSAAISQMGDLRGSYFPRQRQAGAVVLTATKDGSNIRKNFDLYMLGGERTDIETGEVLTESKIKTFLRDRANRVTPLGLEMARLKADGYTVRVAPADRMPETIFEATQLFASINALIEDAAKGVKKDADPNLQRAYNELAKTLTMNIADTFKQRGYLSSRMKRTQDYWEGFETDMLKAGVQYAKGMAGGLAKREAAQKMTLALTGRETTFAEYQDQNPGAKWEDYQQFVRDNAIDPKKQPRLLEETKSWMQEMLRNDEQADRILGTIKGLAVLKFLGFRVSSAAVNMTNMVQAVPATIAAQTGTSISRALGQVGSSARAYKQYRTGKAEQSDKEIFTEISERGWDNPQFNHEAAAVLRSKAGNWFAKFTDAAMWMFGQAEKVNRAVTIHAAYVQAKRMSPDLGHVGWMNKAKQISDDAHGVYGKETAPAWTRGAYNPLKLSYTFQRFMHNYFLNMGQMWERGKYKELTWMLVSPALIAGPGATLLTPIAASMLSALGIGGDDPEEEFYTWAEQTFGEGSTGARVARHGFSGALGVNLKGSLEMGFAMPTTVAELFGAPGSLVTDAVDSVRAFGKGEVSKGFEKALPTGMGTMLKAGREQREGITTGGYSPVWYGEEPLKTTGGGSVARFFGFNPSVTSGVREKLWSEKRIEQKYAGERKRINDRIRRLVLQNNGRIPREDMDEIRGEVARYNERARGLAVPGVPLIKASTIRQAIRSAKRPPRKERLRTNPNI